MKNPKTAVAEILYTLLENFHKVGDQQLRKVRYKYSESSLQGVTLSFESLSLIIQANGADDTIILSVAGSSESVSEEIEVSSLAPWCNLIGMPFGWGWITINQQGYCDGVQLSFQDIRPQLLLNVIASSIKVSVVKLT